LDTKGTAALAASVERLAEMEAITADRKKLGLDFNWKG
jgi:hypothetical protein